MSAASLATLDGSLRMTPVEQPRPPALADLGSRLMIVVERREDWASYLPTRKYSPPRNTSSNRRATTAAAACR